MENYHMDRLIHEFGVSPDRISLLGEFDPHGRGNEIDDPYGCGLPVYTRCYERLRDCLFNYLETLEEKSVR